MMRTPSGNAILPHRRALGLFALLIGFLWIVQIYRFIESSGASLWVVFQWSAAQWMPLWLPVVSSLARSLQSEAWKQWSPSNKEEGRVWEVATLNVTGVSASELPGLAEALHGPDWRDRPLLLQGLWSKEDLVHNSNRSLSLQGLMKEDLVVPYFRDATLPGALTPDSTAKISDIVSNITLQHRPHKIATQFLIERYPELISQVAPTDIVTSLFGNYFEPHHVQATWKVFPAMTTVPVFVASSKVPSKVPAHTGLHCEPIGNVAVQLEGSKRWMLVSPQNTFRIKPAAAPDGRAFFASSATNLNFVERAYVTTSAGDALWVPPWTWHRVDYIGKSDGVSMGASLFHFRPYDFFRNNPLFALLVIPSLLKEVVGYNTQ